MKILIVDDTPDMRNVLSFHLKRQGYEVATACCGEEGLRLAAAESPDLVLMDVSMPGMTGLDACRRLKADSRLAAIPVIMVTCHDSDQDIANGLDAGAEDYVTKPFNPTVLAARVRAALRGKTAADRLRDANRTLEDEIRVRRRVQEALAAAEDQLRQAQKLEAVGRLASGVAHEFNNLLQVIGGYTQCAMQGLDDLKQGAASYEPAAQSSKLKAQSSKLPAVREDLKQVAAAAQRASTLTRQLLGFCRRKPLQRKPVDPNQLLLDAVELARPVLSDCITLQTVPAAPPTTIYADAGELQQALLNLVLNARDAMPAGGTILLKTEIVAVDDALAEFGDRLAPGDYAVIHVTDTGCGMTAEIKEHIFEPFFSTKEVGKGTGLGLANVHGLVRQHGGAVLVDSAPGRGTTFRIFLPLAKSSSFELPLDDLAKPPAAGTPARRLPLGDDQRRLCLSQ